MKLIKETIKINSKEFPVKIHEGEKPQYVFITHHGLLSNKTSWRYFEKWVDEKAIVINYDARVNGENEMRASRLASTYTKDLRDVVRWAKDRYKDIKIVTLGSSWGASVVINHAKKFGKEIYKSVAWSIPYNWLNGSEATETVKENQEKAKIVKSKFKETTPLGYSWRFALMLFLNINARSYTKINLENTADNKTLARINKINKPKKTPVKLFWATAKAIGFSNKNLKQINKKGQNKIIYFQSLKDSYLKNNKLKQLQEISKNEKGVKIVFLNEGRHAFQWEKNNDLNIRVFKEFFTWLKKNN